tara:strand:+ start:92 stop:502 length:411 start_codon:yes stop_codon:yes gene_type:complete
MDQMAIFNISEMENYHLLQIDFMNVPFTDLKFKIFLEEFINIMDFITNSDKIKRFVMYINFKNGVLIPITYIKPFVNTILIYQDMYDVKLICSQAYITSNFMTIVSNVFFKFYKTVKPFLFLPSDSLDIDYINKLI